MNFYLYIITFPNNKKYIGITINIIARQNKHKNRSKKVEYQHLPLYRAINKYGFQNLKWDIINSYSSWKELCQAEINAISNFKTNVKEYGYNTTAGGEGHLKFTPSEETRLKLSKANKGKPKSNEFKEILSKSRMGINNPAFGKPTSLKQKQSVSMAVRGEKNGNAKLTQNQANDIRDKYKSGKYLIQNLAKEYNLNRNAISKIIKNKSYKN